MTQDLMGISEKLGMLIQKADTTEEKIDSLIKYGLPSCALHAAKMSSIEKRLNAMSVSSSSGSDSFSFGKLRAGGTVAVIVGIIVAVGLVVGLVLKITVK